MNLFIIEVSNICSIWLWRFNKLFWFIILRPPNRWVWVRPSVWNRLRTPDLSGLRTSCPVMNITYRGEWRISLQKVSFCLQVKSRTSALGRAANGGLRGRTNLPVTTGNTQAQSRSSAVTATGASPAPIIWRCIWRDTTNSLTHRKCQKENTSHHCQKIYMWHKKLKD
jgi:hypothetical protein